MRPGVLAASVLGAGLSAFVDGIVFHQILGWHHLVSSASGDRRLNEALDGAFHALAWTATLLGLLLLWRVRREADGRSVLGGVLVGAGAFDLVEGVVDHHLLGLHHVHPSGALAWDLAFLAFGAFLLVGGLALLRARPPAGA